MVWVARSESARKDSPLDEAPHEVTYCSLQRMWLSLLPGVPCGVIPKPRVLSSGARDLPLICCCRFGLIFIAPVLRQVLPARIHGFDEPYLLAAPPAFDFLFAINRGIGMKEAFVINKA